tara:strand:- start:17 stop:655 length:639 start_codon:yes stop_codon:yes gene_type:complete
MTPWEIDAIEFGNCNCNFGCPCQFAVLPTHGTCEAAVVMEIRSGHYGKTDLSRVKFAQIVKWPGPIHEGNGEMQLIVDELATDEQKDALVAITTGKDTVEMATMFYIFSAMCPTKHETLRSKIDSELDMENRIARVEIDGILELNGKPIPNIVTGEPHRIRFDVPNGFEFRQGEAASGTAKTLGGNIELLNNNNTHAHFARIYMNGDGVIEH